MAKTHLFKQIFSLAFACLIFGAIALCPQPAKAGWPTWDQFIDKISPLLGLDNDQREAAVFALKHPACAGTIVSYTLEEDYSLLGMITTLKVTKFQSVPKLLPINAGNCKSYQPIQAAYQFIDRKGDDLLGKSKADFLRALLASQIEEGKSTVDSEIAAIPYIGTILSNWECECDAAFESNFKAEKLVDEIVGNVVSVAKSIKSGNYGAALETMISKFGPEFGCKVAEEYSGVGNIPIVSDAASAACEKVAGKVVGWVVSATSTAAEALGIIGGEHIPPEDYYNQMFVPMLGKDGYVQLADTLYNNCYSYFEPTNMAASTAKKVCAMFRERYVVQSAGKLQWNDFEYERGDYYAKNIKPKGEGAALLSDAEYKKIKENVRTECKQYFLQRYPQADIYTAAFNADPIESFCDEVLAYSPSTYHPWDMDKARAKIQQSLTYQMAGKTGYLCKTGDRNVLNCQDGPAMNMCTQSFAKSCAKSTLELGGMETPCCIGGGKPDQSQKLYADAAAKIAKESGGPFCTTATDNPLKITCTVKEAFEACQQHFTWENQRNCDAKEVTGLGQQTQLCCSMDASKLDQVAGMTAIKGFVSTHAQDSNNGCSSGGYALDKFLGYDPRIVSCSGDTNVNACKTAFSGDACKTGDAGFVTKPCCVTAIFGGGGEYVDDYDPAKRDPVVIAKAKKLADDSKGDCTFGLAADGKPDVLRVVCKTEQSFEACVKEAGNGVAERAKCNLTKSGYVSSPCCSRDPSLFYKDFNAIQRKQQELINKGIGNVGVSGKAGKGVKFPGSTAPHDDDAYKAKDDKKPSTNVGDLAKGVDKGGLNDKVKDDAKKMGDALPAAESKTKGAKRAGGDKRAVSDKDNELVAIRLLKAKPLSGASPFITGDVKTKIDPAVLDKGDVAKSVGKTMPGAPAPAADEAPAATTHGPSTAPAAVGPAAVGGFRATNGLTNGAAAPSGFNCTGKSDGDYCSNSTTLVTCTNNIQTNATLCPSGCNSTARACSPYKP